MAEQIKRWHEECLDRASAEYVATEVCLAADVDTALAAKDARIVELEQKIIGLEDAFASNLDYRAMYRQLRAQLASQQTEPCEVGKRIENAIVYGTSHPEMYATPSEDGGEVPVEYQQLSRYGNWDRIEKDVFDLGLIGATPDRFRALYATPVQHSRIVAAKDAEIARLLDDRKKDAVLIHELRAQPARQVGGDERESWFHCPHCGTHEVSLERTCHNSSCLEYAYAKTVHEGWKARAALAPAAVAVDSSAPLVNALEQVRTMVGNDEYADDVIGFINRSIYNHANLNRRAIPEGLIEASRRAADILGSQGFAAWDQLAAELRALLGKEGGV